MNKVELSNGVIAYVLDRDEITERVNQQIARAYMIAIGAGAKLAKAGFDEDDPNTFDAYTSLSAEDQINLQAYQTALIVGMVKEWSLEKAISEDALLDLPRKAFAELSDACVQAWTSSDEFGPDGVTDPKALTAD